MKASAARVGLQKGARWVRPALLATGAAMGAVAVFIGGSSAALAANAPAAAAQVSGGAAVHASPAADAPVVGSLSSFLRGVRFGVPRKDVARVYNKVGGVFDLEYNPVLIGMQPGPNMQAKEAERETRKSAFESSFIEFGKVPLGFDTTGLRGEYSYNNHEHVQTMERDDGRRFFFYVNAEPNEKLWKVYDEIRLGGQYKTVADAVAKIQAQVGVPGRPHAPDPSNGLFLPFTDWQDATAHLRVVDRTGENVVGIVIEDKATLSNIGSFRTNKADDPLAMDPSINLVTKNVTDPNAPPPPPAAGEKPAKPAKPNKKK